MQDTGGHKQRKKLGKVHRICQENGTGARLPRF
jgi:hypothetical protein